MLMRSARVAAATLSLLAALALAGCTEVRSSFTQGLAPAGTKVPTATPSPASSTEASSGSRARRTRPTALKSVDIALGQGAMARPGDSVAIIYTGSLPDGKRFDTSMDSSKPVTFTIGAGTVLKGWDMGLVGMSVGGTRKLTISPKYAYGAKGGVDGKVPPNSTVIFEITLLKIN